MPAPGDQHRDTYVSLNPYIPQPPRISEWSAKEIATLQSRLDKQLGPEFISTRPGAGGGKVHYLAAEKVINLANEVFGFNGWSSSIQQVQVDFVDENTTSGKITLGLSTVVRVTLRDGTFHEDIGYGHIANCSGKAPAFEKAKKEAVTDALKRALRNFGNMLGNCLYDKEYLARISKMKVVPTKWDESRLHRHPDFALVKKEPEIEQPQPQSLVKAAFEDDFESNMFDDLDFSNPEDPTSNPLDWTPAPRPVEPPKSAVAAPPPAPPPAAKPTSAPVTDTERCRPASPSGRPAHAPKGFVTGRAAEVLEKPADARPPLDQLAFDPKHEGSSLRRTPGVNSNASAPVKWTQTGRQAPEIPTTNGWNGPAVPIKNNFVNPSADPNRRVGMPPVPLNNRGAYKPPSLKRPALADLSNMQQSDAEPDAKRAKTAETPPAKSTTV